MKVAALYSDEKNWPVLSAETFPTENFRPVDPILKTVEELLPHDIKVVTTTWGALGSTRGGTPSVCRLIQEKFKIPTVVHLPIQAKTKQDLESILRGLHLDGLDNILALGGDPPAGRVDYVPQQLRHRYASDLVHQIVHLNAGLWMDNHMRYTKPGVSTKFGIGVAGFPEIHPADYREDQDHELNMQRNVEHLKMKINAGAQYVIEQMIFDVDLHFDFIRSAREAGINVPIIPGILPFERFSQVENFIGGEYRVSLPTKFYADLQNAPEEDQKQIIEDHMAAIVKKLLDAHVPGIHFYCMNKSAPTIRLLDRARG